MKYIRTLVAVGALVASFVLVGGNTVLAQNDEQVTPPEAPSTTQQEERQERAETRALERCEQVTERLTTRIGRVNEATERQTTIYERIADRLDNVIESAEAVSYDTTALLEARDAVNLQIEAFVATSTDFTSDLAASADVACSETPVAYGTAISGARESLREVRAAALAVRTTFREQAIPALQDLRAFLAALETTTNEEEEAPVDGEGVN